MKNKISPFFFYFFSSTKGVILALILGFLFFFYFTSRFLDEKKIVDDYETRVDSLIKHANASLPIRTSAKEFFAKYQHANPYYLKERLEPLILCEKEQQKVRRLLSHSAFAHNTDLQKRLQFLSIQNRLSLAEDLSSQNDNAKIVEEKIAHPVELDNSDLEKLLCAIEGVPIGSNEPLQTRPYLFIKHFALSLSSNHLFLNDLKIIKRDVTP